MGTPVAPDLDDTAQDLDPRGGSPIRSRPGRHEDRHTCWNPVSGIILHEFLLVMDSAIVVVQLCSYILLVEFLASARFSS